MVVMALEGIERVLQTEEIQELAALENGDERRVEYLIPPKFFEALQKHKSPGIAKKAKKIWTQVGFLSSYLFGFGIYVF